MNREQRVVNFIKQNPYVTLNDIKNHEKVSERTARQIIKTIKEEGKRAGYQLKTIRNRGYVLQIEDGEKFRDYEVSEAHQDDHMMSQEYRVNVILKLLLQQNTFLTINEIANYLNVGRSTIIKDLILVRKRLADENIELHSKSHYGLRISGTELNIRRALMRFVVKDDKEFSGESDYFSFIQMMDKQDLRENIQAIFHKNKLASSNLSFFSIITHIKMLLYRLSENNLISEFKQEKEIDPKFLAVADELADFLEEHYEISIPKVERDYLSAQIAGKTSIDNLSMAEQSQIEELLDKALMTIDSQFLTRFEKDQELRNALLLHIYPLLQRVTFKLELTNPLIDVVSARYANTFLIALRFAKLIEHHLSEKMTGLAISRDEIGYLALHFSTSLERQEAQIISSVRRIFLLSNEGRATDSLLKLKIENSFPNANVIQRTHLEGENLQESDIDLLLTTDENFVADSGYQTIRISSMPTDSEMTFLKKQVLLSSEIHLGKSGKQKILELFRPSLFRIVENDTKQDYFYYLKEMAQEIVELDFAPEELVESVMKREKAFSTIYENGVAGPHGMSMNAYQDCISVTIFKNPIKEGEKEVSIIFLLNMKQGHLFLYKEISNLLMTLIERKDHLGRILVSRNFEDFLERVAELI